MIRKVFGFILAGVFFLIAFASAQAGNCFDTVVVAKYLRDSNGEKPVSVVNSERGYKIITYRSDKTYTVVFAFDDGKSCVMDAGTIEIKEKGIGL